MHFPNFYFSAERGILILQERAIALVATVVKRAIEKETAEHKSEGDRAMVAGILIMVGGVASW